MPTDVQFHTVTEMHSAAELSRDYHSVEARVARSLGSARALKIRKTKAHAMK